MRRSALTFLAGLLMAGGLQTARAQITTHTALPITEGRGVVRMMTRLVQASGPLGKEMPATGGWTWLLDPGLHLVTRRVVIEGAVPLPVYQDVGAAVLEKGPTFILSTRVDI